MREHDIEHRDYRAPAGSMVAQRSASGGRRLTGYAALTGVRSQLLDAFYEVLAPGVFADSLKRQPDVFLLHDHKSANSLARTPATLHLQEDSKGLKFTADLPDTSLAADIHEQVRAGILDGCSFSFTGDQVKWDNNPDPADFPIRTVERLTMWEISVVAWPAYTQTSVQARGEPKPALPEVVADRLQSIEAAVRDGRARTPARSEPTAMEQWQEKRALAEAKEELLRDQLREVEDEYLRTFERRDDSEEWKARMRSLSYEKGELERKVRLLRASLVEVQQ